jgi:hypothetical protein
MSPQLWLLISRFELFPGFLFSRHRSLEAVTFRAHLNDMSAVSDSVQQRFAQPRAGEYLRPLRE